jgi:hypothetical protein
VDEGVDAWKRSIWDAARAYMTENEVMASVSADIPNLKDLCDKLGFTMESEPVPGQKKVQVRGKIPKEKLVQLVARRGDADRETDVQTAQAIFNAVGIVANNQFLTSVVDPASIVELVEFAAKLAGADADFKFQVNQDGAMAKQLQATVQQIQQQIMTAVEQEVAQPAAQAIAKTNGATADNASKIQQLTGILEQVQQMMSAAAPMPQPSVQLRQTQVLPPPGAPVAPIPQPDPTIAPIVPGNGTALDASVPEHREVAKHILKHAKGNKTVARALARTHGYK